jgi:hypothetical protein
LDLKELDLVNPYSHWYYQSKLAAVKRAADPYLNSSKRMVDVGAGSGFFGEALVNNQPQIKLVCVDLNYPDSSKEKNGVLYQNSPKGCDADIYLFIDVLEHVNDDTDLLLTYFNQAKVGSVFIQTVPAFQFLWSGHDVFLEHIKRYRRRELVSVNRHVGLKIVRSGYLFSTIFPLVVIARKFSFSKSTGSDMKNFSPFVNSILKLATSFEHKFSRNRFFGLSVIVVSQKV